MLSKSASFFTASLFCFSSSQDHTMGKPENITTQTKITEKSQITYIQIYEAKNKNIKIEM